MDKVLIMAQLLYYAVCINNLQFYVHNDNILFVVITYQEIK